ncbi:MAG: hypothetical protein ACRDOP_17175, partial [Gaiellaceae bacterium]
RRGGRTITRLRPTRSYTTLRDVTLAYPFGAYDARIECLAWRAGYVLAVTTESGVQQSARRPLALPRLRILDSTGVRGLAAMLAAAR